MALTPAKGFAVLCSVASQIPIPAIHWGFAWLPFGLIPRATAIAAARLRKPGWRAFQWISARQGSTGLPQASGVCARRGGQRGFPKRVSLREIMELVVVSTPRSFSCLWQSTQSSRSGIRPPAEVGET